MDLSSHAEHELTAAQEELLLVLADESARGVAAGRVGFAVLVQSVGRSEAECVTNLAELKRLGLVAIHDAGPGRSLQNAASLTAHGERVAFNAALVSPQGRVSDFADELSALQLEVLDVVTEGELRNAGAAPTRTHVRSALRARASDPGLAIDEASKVVDSLVGTHLSVLGGREPSYQVTLRGLLLSKWGINALQIVDGMLRLLRRLQGRDPALFRYSWTTARAALDLPRKAANLFYITVTRSNLGRGIFRSEGEDWWATPPELDALLEVQDGLGHASRLADHARPSNEPLMTPTRDDGQAEANLPALRERVARLEASTAPAENPTVRVHEAFDRLDFHPVVASACTKLFRDGHYRNAVLDAAVAVDNYVQIKSGRNLSGAALMNLVFSANTPLLAFSSRKTPSERDEQEGMMHLFVGASKGLRNPRAHGLDADAPEVAFEAICFFSFLCRQLDRAEPTPAAAIP